MPTVHRNTPGWEAFLKEVGLVWGEVPKPVKKKSSKTAGADREQFCTLKQPQSTMQYLLLLCGSFGQS